MDKCFSWKDRIRAAQDASALNDVVFVVEGESFRTNKTIMAMASPVMFAQFFGPLAEKKSIITETGSARGFGAMLDFIHEEDYSIADLLDGQEEITASDELARVMEVVHFGDKYQIQSLICFCRNILLQKIKLTSENFFNMYNEIIKHRLPDSAFRIVFAQIKAFEVRIVDVKIFHRPSLSLGCSNTDLEPPNGFQIKFKINQDAFFFFDVDKQDLDFEDNCRIHEYHESPQPYKRISWKPQNGLKEIATGKQINSSKFYAESNIEITLEFELCRGYMAYNVSEIPENQDGKFETDDVEVKVIEINRKPFNEAITSAERLPLSLLSFQPLVRVIE